MISSSTTDKGFLNDSKLCEHSAQLSNANWINDLQQKAAEKYLQQNLPTRKTEHWKYNDVSFFKANDYLSAEQLAVDESLIEKLTLEVNFSQLIVLVNGRLAENASKINNDSVIITPFESADAAQKEYIGSQLSDSSQNKNLFLDLNNAIYSDGLLIDIPANDTVDAPIYILQLSTETESSAISGSQILVRCGKNSNSQVIEHFASLTKKPLNDSHDSSQQFSQFHFALQQTVIDIEANALCTHTRLNLEKPSARQVSRVLNRLERDSKLESFYFSRGSSLNRTDIDVWHEGTNSHSELTGIYLPSNKDTIDYHTCIEHRVPHCTSREVFRGIIADESKATFNGKIHIFKDAQKSDAQLSNKNLLLTNQAEINTKPELEIYADDVVCAHGATIAKIDEKAIYYLQTRGINELNARKMLSIGFINELLVNIKNEALMSAVARQLEFSLSDLNS
jgi:Fe-S cluster assembly protein SufD